MRTINNTVVIELDGASWNVIKDLLERDMIPNIRRLIDNGSSGVLLSEEPLLSPRLWVSIFSGKRAQDHGVEFFGHSSSIVQCKRIWDIFNDRGYSVGVFGSFVTWPPYPVNGFMIPYLFALGPETYPDEYGFFQEVTLRAKKEAIGFSKHKRAKSLIHYALKMKKHGVDAGTLLGAAMHLIADKLSRTPAEKRYFIRAKAYLRMSTGFFIHLYKKFKPKFATFHIHLCDAVSHKYWKYYEPDKFSYVNPVMVKRYRRIIPKAYVEADRMIGKIVRSAERANIILVSDHGTNAIESLRSSYRLNVEAFMNKLKLDKGVIPANVGLISFMYFKQIKMKDRFFDIISKANLPNSKEKIFAVREEGSLLGLRLAPNLQGKEIPDDEAVDLGEFGTCRFGEIFVHKMVDVSGSHGLEGVVIMAGPDIKPACKIKNASIYDITPTILALAGFPVAKDMNGKVLEQLMTDRTKEDNPISYIESYDRETKEPTEEVVSVDTDDEIKRRLKSLGYL
jgi:hypothetical protein